MKRLQFPTLAFCTLLAAHAQAQAQASEAAAPVAETAAGEPSNPPVAETAAGEPSNPPAAPAPRAQAPSTADATAPRPAASSGPPAPPVRDFPVPDDTPPPEPEDWDAPRFPSPNQKRAHSFETGFHFGVPIWLTAEADVEPGFAIAGRWGFTTGQVVPEFHIGWQSNGIDDGTTMSDQGIDAFNIGMGVRWRIGQSTPVAPFVAGAFDLNFWHLAGDTTLACGAYYCREEANYEFSPGLSVQAGVNVDVAPSVSFEFGARVGMTFAAGVMEQTELWITPLAGMAFYFR